MLRHTYKQACYWIEAAHRSRDVPSYECPLCGFRGKFSAHGFPPRFGARCPKCKSLERHRLICLALQAAPLPQGSSILHFAPEKIMGGLLRKFGTVKSADIVPGRADLTLNIEQIDLPSESFDVVVANHVLEHVDDRRALSELFRILAHGGTVIATVPVCDGWDVTYENGAITSPEERRVHFGQHDHVRRYGRDFRDRLEDAGFALSEFMGTPEQCIKHGLLRGERVFFGQKPQARG